MSLTLRRGLFAVSFALFASSCASSSPLVFDTAIPVESALADQPAGTAIGDDQGGALDDSALTGNEFAESDEGDGGQGAAVEPATQSGVESAFNRLMAGWIDCFHRPARCEVARLTVSNSPERQRLTESLNFYVTEKIRTKPDEGRLQWNVESVSLPSNDRARLVSCEYDTRIFFDTSMADTEFGDIIFDTTVWTRRVEWTLARSGESWSLWSRRIERRSPVARFCTP
jgi:hypothetical protein